MALAIIEKEKADFPLMKMPWSGSTDLEEACTTIPELIERTVKDKYQTVDVDKTFKGLRTCGELLQTAYIGAGRQPCSVTILKVIDNYQNLCNDCCVGSSSFVNASVAALKAHKLALLALDKGKQDIAIKQFDKIAALATDMVKTAQKLENNTQALVVMTGEAVHTAKGDENVAREMKEQMQRKINETTALKASLSAKVESLETTLSQTREEEERVATQVQQAADRANTQALLGMAMHVVSEMNPVNALNKAVNTVLNPIPKMLGSAAGAMVGAMRDNGGKFEGIERTADAMVGAMSDDKEHEFGNVQQGSGSGGVSGVSEKMAREAKQEYDEVAAQIEQLQALRQLDKDQQNQLQGLKDKARGLKAKAESMAGEAKKNAAMMMAHAETMEAKHSLVAARRRDLEDEMRKENAALAETLAQMATMKSEKTTVEKAVISLTACVQALTKILTTFKNVKLFWQCTALEIKRVGAMAKQISAADEDALEEMELECGGLKGCFQESAVNWAALGHMNLQAHSAMTAAKQTTDSIMENLPDASDPKFIALMERSAKTLLAAVEADTLALDNK